MHKSIPYLVRASASGANVVGSIVAICTSDRNPFFYLALYAGLAYFATNAYEGYKEVYKTDYQRLDSWVDRISMDGVVRNV